MKTKVCNAPHAWTMIQFFVTMKSIAPFSHMIKTTRLDKHMNLSLMQFYLLLQMTGLFFEEKKYSKKQNILGQLDDEPPKSYREKNMHNTVLPLPNHNQIIKYYSKEAFHPTVVQNTPIKLGGIGQHAGSEEDMYSCTSSPSSCIRLARQYNRIR